MKYDVGSELTKGEAGACRLRAAHHAALMVGAAGCSARPLDSEANERYLTAAMVCERYSISKMTVWRWLRAGSNGFPTPVYLGSHRYWRLSELVAWEHFREQAQSPSQGDHGPPAQKSYPMEIIQELQDERLGHEHPHP